VIRIFSVSNGTVGSDLEPGVLHSLEAEPLCKEKVKGSEARNVPVRYVSRRYAQ
jgi:hypothetical protein